MKSHHVLNKKKAFEKLCEIEQEHLLRFWDALSEPQRLNFLRQIENLDLNFFRMQKEMLKKTPKKQGNLAPFEAFFHSGNKEDESRGKMLVAEGKTACLVLAGGQGSRLHFEGPKGCYPISPFKKKSLYQLIAEKVRVVGEAVKKNLLIAIMTSPLNHEETENFFIQNHFFGLKRQQISFFSQKMWPLLDFEENLFLQAPDQIALGPNGNGEVFLRMMETKIYEKWSNEGIEMINIIPVDNPLASPFDFELFGFHDRQKCCVTFKTSLRKNFDEKVGILVLKEGKPVVLEYSEIQNQPDKPTVANLGLYCVSMPFIEKAANFKLPLHVAKKAVKRLDSEGNVILSKKPSSWKFEKFIFDAFAIAEKCEALLYDREDCFAPLKNLEGEDSIDTVKAALLALDRKLYKQVTGVSVPRDAEFELAPEFHCPAEPFLLKWKGKPLSDQKYIEVS